MLRQFIRTLLEAEDPIPIKWAPALKAFRAHEQGKQLDHEELRQLRRWWWDQLPSGYTSMPEETEAYYAMDAKLKPMFAPLDEPGEEIFPAPHVAFSSDDVQNAIEAVKVWRETGEMPPYEELERMWRHVLDDEGLDKKPAFKRDLKKSLGHMLSAHDRHDLGIEPDLKAVPDPEPVRPKLRIVSDD